MLTSEAKMHHTGPVMETLEEFFRPYLNGDSGHEVGRKLGMTNTTVTRQMKGNMPVRTVVKLCRAYAIPMLDAFVAAGYITEAEADVMGRTRGLRAATERELVQEMMRRVVDGDTTATSTEPVGQDIIDASARLATDSEAVHFREPAISRDGHTLEHDWNADDL
ncbi:hypothetical protein [Clavibacter michiganensis]|uniref:Uncharacterized protein n=2 Tax=Clavibacter TaxID=1573 RepID=A0A399NYI6_9MICO|nr:hypothetical protein [Clavibacter michiganensis]RII98984.1 hypothetical protein DZF96_00610 [Clavibacter michiganensis]